MTGPKLSPDVQLANRRRLEAAQQEKADGAARQRAQFEVLRVANLLERGGLAGDRYRTLRVAERLRAGEPDVRADLIREDEFASFVRARAMADLTPMSG